MRSADEQEIRDAVVACLRQHLPDVRIIHELNVAGHGSNRIDVAAVTPQAIVAVEIKSKKDTLSRLADQWKAFNAACHRVYIAAHEKHFREHREKNWSDDHPSDWTLDHPLFADKWHSMRNVWRYPAPDETREPMWRRTWRVEPKELLRQPRAVDLLGLLWAAELRDECARHRLAAGSRRVMGEMVQDMAWNMTGREIAEAVCRQLRKRHFMEADQPIAEKEVAA